MGEFFAKISPIARLGETMSLIAHDFFDVQERLFWPYLASSLVIAGLLGLRQKKFRSVMRETLNPALWFHASALLDYKIFLIKILLKVLLGPFFLLSSLGVAVWVKSSLESIFGATWGLSVAVLAFLPAWAISLFYSIVIFVIWDLSQYVLHRALHEIDFLWQIHKVHHSAEVLTPLTFYRTHPIEALLYNARNIVVTGFVAGIFFYFFRERAVALDIMGVNALGFLMTLLGANLRHSHIWLSYGPFWEKVLISPAQHQMHHSSDPKLSHKNYGVWFAFWDRLAGSLCLAPQSREFDFGILPDEANHNPHGLISSMVHPPLRAVKLIATRIIGVVNRFRPVTRGAVFLVCFLAALGLNAQEKSQKAKPESAKNAAQKKSPRKSSDADLTLDTISIIGTDSRVSGSAHTINEAELQRFKSNDVERVLKTLPGVYTRPEDGYGLRPNIGIRGASSDRSAKVTLMEDGVLLAPAPYSAPAAYYFPMMARITGVEVFKGPASVRYGPNTIGGAINLQTRPLPDATMAFADLSSGLNLKAEDKSLRLHGYGGHGSEHWGVLAEAVHLQSTGFKELDGGGDTGFSKTEGTVRARLQTDTLRKRYQQFDVRLGYSRERSNETYLGLTDADLAANPVRRYAGSQLDQMNWHRTQVRLDYLFHNSRSFDFLVTVYRHDFHRIWRRLSGFRRGPDLSDLLASPEAGQAAVYYSILAGKENTLNEDQDLLLATNDRTFVSQGVVLNNHWRPTTGKAHHDIETALRFHHDYIDRYQTGDDYAMTSGALIRTSRATDLNDDNRGEARALAFHVHDTITFQRLVIAPGVRVENVRTNLANHKTGENLAALNTSILPGFGAHFQANKWLGLLAGVHKGFSPVSPGQAPEVKPEESVNYEGGLRLGRRKTKAEAIGFFNNYSNLTSECTFSTGCSEALINKQFNAGHVYVYGLESMVSQGFSLPGKVFLTLKGMYTLTLSRFLSAFTSANPQLGDVVPGDELPYVPKHQATFLTRVEKGLWALDVSVSYVGQMRDKASHGDVPSTLLIPANTVVDLGSSFEVIENGQAYVAVSNLLDSSYMTSRRPFGARPGRPFQVMIGFKYLLSFAKKNQDASAPEAKPLAPGETN